MIHFLLYTFETLETAAGTSAAKASTAEASTAETASASEAATYYHTTTSATIIVVQGVGSAGECVPAILASVCCLHNRVAHLTPHDMGVHTLYLVFLAHRATVGIPCQPGDEHKGKDEYTHKNKDCSSVVFFTGNILH